MVNTEVLFLISYFKSDFLIVGCGMSDIGIGNTDNNEWVVALCIKGKSVFSRPFKSTSTELGALVRFITEHCERPKICLNPVNPSAMKLLKFIGNIPGVEVMLMSNAGLELHRDWLPRESVTSFIQNYSRRAYLLACYAERTL